MTVRQQIDIVAKTLDVAHTPTLTLWRTTWIGRFMSS